MQYISTKFLPATDTKGSRIKATCSFSNDSIIRSYDYSLDVEKAHAKVAIELAKKMEWDGEYASGGNDSGYIFAFIGNSNVYSTEEVTA